MKSSNELLRKTWTFDFDMVNYNTTMKLHPISISIKHFFFFAKNLNVDNSSLPSSNKILENNG